MDRKGDQHEVLSVYHIRTDRTYSAADLRLARPFAAPASAPASVLCPSRSLPARLTLPAGPARATLRHATLAVSCRLGPRGLSRRTALLCVPELAARRALTPLCLCLLALPDLCPGRKRLSQTRTPLLWCRSAGLRHQRTRGELPGRRFSLLRYLCRTCPHRPRALPARGVVCRSASPACCPYPRHADLPDQTRTGLAHARARPGGGIARPLGRGRYRLRPQPHAAHLARGARLRLRAGGSFDRSRLRPHPRWHPARRCWKPRPARSSPSRLAHPLGQ